jgi:hypothetical protein
MSGAVLYPLPAEEVGKVAREVKFMVRLTSQEKELIDLLAERLGEARSVVVRRAVRELARKEGVEFPNGEERTE